MSNRVPSPNDTIKPASHFDILKTAEGWIVTDGGPLRPALNSKAEALGFAGTLAAMEARNGLAVTVHLWDENGEHLFEGRDLPAAPTGALQGGD